MWNILVMFQIQIYMVFYDTIGGQLGFWGGKVSNIGQSQAPKK